jgi:iron complex outermembrane receptor protein
VVSSAPPEELASSSTVWRRTSVPFALLRNSRKTVAVSSAPPEGLASSSTVWRRTSVPFALQKSQSRNLVLLGLALLAITCRLNADGAPDDIASKSIEELMNVDVTSVSRKEQKLSRTPAAVYVITQDAIQRSGATNIPDLLRMVPGVQVAQVDANRWAISVRGFNNVYSNKLLVLVDGRTIYTPTFSGVYWDQIDIPLDTIERIEVVRGPGGTVWGANAVNGVINIITKNSKDTQGARVMAGGGSHQSGDYDARFGGRLGSVGTYRASGDFRSFDSLPTATGAGGYDGWHSEHGGVRADVQLDSKDSLMVEANATETSGGATLLDFGNPASGQVHEPVENRALDVTGRWVRQESDHSDTTLQVYESGYNRTDTGTTERVNTLDFDFQQHMQFGSRNDVVWGAGYRFNSDETGNALSEADSFASIGAYIRLQPQSKQYILFSAFLQDEITLTNSLALTVGSKVEHNAFSGFQYEPSARLAWTPSAKTTWWLAASKAVTQPSRLETGLNLELPTTPLGGGLALTEAYLGNPQQASETMRDYEIGYRVMPASKVSLDLTGFYSLYHSLQSAQLAPAAVAPLNGGLLLTVPLMYGNGLSARNSGAEASVTWSALHRWKLTGSFSLLRTHETGAEFVASSLAVASLAAILPPAYVQAIVGRLSESNLVQNSGNASPRQQAGLQSYFDLNARTSFDTSVYYVASLDQLGVPAYTRLDARFQHKFRGGIEASIVGQNLLQARHLEFGDTEQYVQTEVERTIFGQVVWKF